MRIFLTMLAVGYALVSTAQDQLTIETYTRKQGLSHDIVSTVFQDSRGLIWAGTNYGLNLFDGTKFYNYYHIPSDSNSLPDNNVLSIAEDKNQRLWLGMPGGISCFDFLANTFRNYKLLQTDAGKKNIEFCFVFVSKNNTVWIGTNSGIFSLDPRTGQSKFFTLQLCAAGSFCNAFVSDFYEDENDNLWATTSYGVYQKARMSNRFVQTMSAVDGKYSACNRILADEKGSMYVSTWDLGLLYKTKNSDSFYVVAKPSSNSLGPSFDMMMGGDSTVWISTFEGITTTTRRSLERKAPLHFTKMMANDHQLPPVVDMIRDRDGRIWLATSKGLIKINNQKAFVQTAAYDSISTWNPRSFYQMKKDSLVILNGKLLMLYNLKTNAFRKIIPSLAFGGKLFHAGDHFWITARPGLLWMNDRFEKQQWFTCTDEKGGQVHFNHVVEDRDGMVWLSASGRKGIYLLNPKTKAWTHLLYRDNESVNLSGHDVDDLLLDKNGDVWIASDPVVCYRRTLRQFEVIKLPEDKHATARRFYNAGDSLWIGSTHGLFCYSFTAKRIHETPLPVNVSPSIDEISRDQQGNLWFSSSTGLLRLEKDKGHFRLFNEVNGFPQEEISSLSTLSDGRIVFGYDGHIGIIDPGLIPAISRPAAPKWTQILVDNTSLPDEDRQHISLNYRQSISFSFISPNYDNSSRNQYAYMLQGIDKEWNYIGTNTTQRFANLPAGSYTFKLKAASSDGIWSGEITSFHFIVRPPFWRTWWFYTICLFTIISLVYAIYRYQLKQALKVERIRMRIASDLHDDVGATLSSISMYSEAVKKQVKEKMPNLEPVLEKMGENSRNMVGSMSDIVWAINPENDDAEKMLMRMESYAKDNCSLKNMQLEFSADEKLKGLSLTLDQRKNIYLIFKEALNNALKYSDASLVRVCLEKRGHLLLMKIEDDGNGFNPENVRQGNGLKNLQSRAKEINGTLEIFSIGGTQVQLKCHL